MSLAESASERSCLETLGNARAVVHKIAMVVLRRTVVVVVGRVYRQEANGPSRTPPGLQLLFEASIAVRVIVQLGRPAFAIGASLRSDDCIHERPLVS